MITLITILPLVGSFLFININEEAFINSDKASFASINIQQKNNSIIKQIGLSTSLIVLILTIYILIKSSLILPNFSNELESLSKLVNIYSNSYNSIQFGTLNSSSINELENIDSISLFYIYFESVLIPLFMVVGI